MRLLYFYTQRIRGNGALGKRVRTLLRVSSKQQLHDDDIPMQRAQAKQYIAGRPDWVFDKEYMEKAVSAYKNSVAPSDATLPLTVMRVSR